MFLSARNASRLGAALLLVCCCAPALAQNNVRGPSNVPVPLRMVEPQDAAKAASQNASQGLALDQAQDAAKNATTGATPGAMKDAAKDTAKKAAPQPKFPNKDTAKNRQDYEMGTDSGSDFIQLGRDEATGDNVMTHKPPKRARQKDSFEEQPIQVRPVVPVWK